MSQAVLAAKPVAVRAGASTTDILAIVNETLVRPVRQWFAWREAVTALNGLKARDLRDIGVEGDVESFAWEMVSRR